MTLTLSQKHPVMGKREFRLVEDEIQCDIKSPLKTESLSVVLFMLDPDPVISGSTVSFLSHVNREPLVKMFLNKPDKETFEQFVSAMQQRISEEDFGRYRARDKQLDVDVERLDRDIKMLQSYVNTPEIEPFLAILLKLKENPEDMESLNSAINMFNELGFVKAQILTYASYVNFLLSGAGDN